MHWRRPVTVLATIAALSLAACGSSDPAPAAGTGTTSSSDAPSSSTGTAGSMSASTTEASTGSAEPATVKVAIFPAIVQVPFLLAQYKGYYNDENLTVEFQAFQNSQDAIVLLSQEQLDVVPGSINAGLLNSIAGGLDLAIVGSYSLTSPPSDCPDCEPPSGILVRKSLLDENPNFGYADMAGHVMAAAGGIGASPSYQIGTYLEEGGLTLNDVTWQPLTIPDTMIAFQNGTADVAVFAEPFKTEALETGIAAEFGSPDLYAGDTIASILMGPSLLNDNQDVAVRFLRATMRAAAELQGNYIDNPDAVAAIVQYLGFSEEDVQKSVAGAVPIDLAYNPATLEHFQQIMFQAGDVLDFEAPMPTDQVVNTELAAEAYSTLDK